MKEMCDSEVLEGFLRGGKFLALVLKSSFKFIRQKRGGVDNPTRKSQEDESSIEVQGILGNYGVAQSFEVEG